MSRFKMNLEHGTQWPYQRSFLNPEPLRCPPPMSAKRSARKEIFRSEKMNRDVQCDSLLEHTFYAELDRLPGVLYYQEQPVALGWENPKNRWPYRPDVLISFTDGRCVMAEIKPMSRMIRFQDLQKWQSLISNSELAGMGFFIGDPKWSLRDLVQMDTDGQLDEELRGVMERGSVRWEELKSVRDRLRKRSIDLCAAAFRCNVVFEGVPLTGRNATDQEGRVFEDIRRWFDAPVHESHPAPLSVRTSVAASSRVSKPASRSTYRRPPNAFKRWTPEEEKLLLAEFERTKDVADVARCLGRNPEGIRRRLIKLGIPL